MSENILYNVLECLKKYWKNVSEEHANILKTCFRMSFILKDSLWKSWKKLKKKLKNVFREFQNMM